jgi:hypothetical protein
MSNSSLTDKARNYMLQRAKAMSTRKRNQGINFRDITNETNRRLGTNYSISQVSAYLGNMRYRQTRTS